MIQVRWTPQAAEDLQAIYDFIARDSTVYAQLTVEDILSAIDRLTRFPLLGRRVPERERDDLRELIKPPYRIVYRTGEVLKILTIFRGSRSFPPDLE
ncbi:MAG: toxin ParE1/3/4 [Blastocatellia bacterium]|nr:toxin ParE1/3/4 [Blastocatellia bacterium]